MAEYALEAIMKQCEIDDIIGSINGFGMIESSRHMSVTHGKFLTVHSSLPRDTEDSILNMTPLNNFIMTRIKKKKTSVGPVDGLEDNDADFQI